MKIAVIPARGGSKRIPRKNIRDFAGRPIMAHSIEAALNADIFDRVLVSTDDEEIAEIAQKYGADVPFLRPDSLSDDHAVIADVVAHAVRWYDKAEQSVAFACCVYATAPFIDPSTIVSGLESIEMGQADFSLSVCTFAYPIQRALKLDEQGCVSMINSEYALTRSQDLDECYHDAAQFFWGSAEAFKGNVQSCRTAGVVVPRYSVQDIDTEEDWQQAELMYRALQLKKF